MSGTRVKLAGDIGAAGPEVEIPGFEDAFALTCKLIMTHDGKKMGKTEKGALWLDPNRTTPYEFYQYWRNVADQDVERFLALLTFLPMDEVRRLGALEGAEINEAKKVLAFEITKMIHGEEEAKKAADAAQALFAGGGSSENMPTTEITADELVDGELGIMAILVRAGLCASNSEARRNIQQGGVTVDDVKVTDINAKFSAEQLKAGIVVKRGKKNFKLEKTGEVAVPPMDLTIAPAAGETAPADDASAEPAEGVAEETESMLVTEETNEQ